MPSASPQARLTDIVEAIELIGTEMANVTLEAPRTDKRKRWLVERGMGVSAFLCVRRFQSHPPLGKKQYPAPGLLGKGHLAD